MRVTHFFSFRSDLFSSNSVFLVKEVPSGKQQALKLFKPTVDPDTCQYEAKITLSISHPRVCSAIQFFPQIILPPSDDSPTASWNTQPLILPALVLEYVPNGDLVKLTKSLGCLPETVARTYFLQLVDALECIHEAGVCHLDIKPDNILLDENYCVKLADFGLALETSGRTGLKETAGTPPYFSPEMHLNLKYSGFQADLFALGVTLFSMVVGTLPFGEAKLEDPLYNLIAYKNYEEFWKYHSGTRKQGAQFYNQSFRDLIQKMLAYKVDERLSIKSIKCHEWVKGLTLSDKSLGGIVKYYLQKDSQVKSTLYTTVKSENIEKMMITKDAKILSSQ